jgi:excisionase family DNA binding protein
VLDIALVTRKEAARCLGVTMRTIDRWRKEGKLKGMRAGPAHILITEESILGILQEEAPKTRTDQETSTKK